MRYQYIFCFFSSLVFCFFLRTTYVRTYVLRTAVVFLRMRGARVPPLGAGEGQQILAALFFGVLLMGFDGLTLLA